MDQGNFGTVQDLIQNDQRGKEFQLCCLKRCGNSLSKIDGQIRDKYHKVSVTIQNIKWINNLNLIKAYHIEIIEGHKVSKGSGSYLFIITKSRISPPLLNPKHQTSKEYVSQNRNIRKTIQEFFETRPSNIIKKIKENVKFNQKVQLDVRGIQQPNWGTFQCQLYDRDDTINAEIFYKGGSGKIIFNRYQLNANKDKVFITQYEWQNKPVEELPNPVSERQVPEMIQEKFQKPSYSQPYFFDPNYTQRQILEEQEDFIHVRPLPTIFHQSISMRQLQELKITQDRAYEKISQLSSLTYKKQELKKQKKKLSQKQSEILGGWSLNLLLIDKTFFQNQKEGKITKLLTLYFYVAGKNKGEQILREKQVKVVLFGDLALKKYHLLECGKFYEIYSGKFKEMYQTKQIDNPNDNLYYLQKYWFQIHIRYPNVDATEISRSQILEMQE